jgi:hypothetical protein
MAKSPAKKKFQAAFGVTVVSEAKATLVKSALRKMVVAGLSGNPSNLDDGEKSAVAGLSFTALSVVDPKAEKKSAPAAPKVEKKTRSRGAAKATA